LFSSENKIIYYSLLKELQKEQELSKNDLSLDPQILEKITKFASIKHILNKIKNDEYKTLELLEEIIGDIKNHELEIRIEKLESKFSRDLDESTFNEIRKLKKSQKIN
jgi:DNA primase